MAAGFGALRHDDVGAGIKGTFGTVEILYLAEEGDARRLDARREPHLVAKGEAEDFRRMLQRLIEELGEAFERPGDIADADPGVAGGAELILHPGFAAI